MKKIILSFFAASLILFACNNDATKTDEKKTEGTEKKEEPKAADPAKPKGPPDSAAMAEMMKKWQDFATPGDQHKWMAKHVGTFEAEVSQWMDPGAPPTKAMAKMVSKSALNGLYVIDDYTSTMMGQPFSGHGVMGYDKVKKMYVSTWVDNAGSGIVRMEGTYDEATKTLNMKGKQSDPISGKETDIRQEQKWIDDNTNIFTMYGTGMDGVTEQKFMEGTFKRKN